MPTNNTSGWINSPDDVMAVESEVGIFGSTADFLTGTGAGQIRCLHDNYEKIGIDFPHRNQGPVGSCVAFGVAGGVDAVKVTEIANGEREIFKAATSEEPIYYGARVVIGKNRIRGDGAIVAYAVKYIAEYGTIAKGKYGNIDISQYSPDRCRKWGTGSGFPKTIETISKETVIQAYSRVKSWEEARDSIYNGDPVVFGSSYGFSSETDDEGFCRQNTNWNHCMFLIAMDDLSRRKGGLISNSWGRKWLKIRKRKLNQPDGCFWADDEVIDKIMRNGDAWSISQFKGYKKEINTDISW